MDLAITLTDSMGNPVTSEIYADTYTLKYELVDKYGKPTNSSLLGKVNYTISTPSMVRPSRLMTPSPVLWNCP